jgi:FAD/FMN-containing dehydrogenase
VTPERIDRAAELAGLRSRVDGPVILPTDPGWGDARTAWNLAVDQRPAAVSLVESVGDVVATVELARDLGLRIAPQGTGHGTYALELLDDTILVRTSHLRGVEIDGDGRRARVEAGARWADVVAPAAQQGFLVLHGTSPDVGVIGYTLAGGIGWLARSRGLAANNVIAIDMVTADGRFVRADHVSEPDLFWAARGGGGSFGVVTAIELEMFDAPDLYAGAMVWPIDRAGEILHSWRSWTDDVPDEVTSVARILHLPRTPDIAMPLRGGSFAVVEAVFSGPERLGAELLAPLRALEPLENTFASAPPTALQNLCRDPRGPVPAVGEGMLLEQLPHAAIDELLAAAVPSLLTVEIRQLGGALAESSTRHGAVGSITAAFAVFTSGSAPAPAIGVAAHAAVDRVTAALRPWQSERSCFDFSRRPIDAARLFPAETYARLRRLKAAHDPDQRIVSSHPIAPG